MATQKNISINLELFTLLVNYFYEHPHLDDLNFDTISDAINQKIDALYKHNIYSIYKSDPSQTNRALARKEYLQLIGLKDSFLWNDSDDFNLSHH